MSKKSESAHSKKLIPIGVHRVGLSSSDTDNEVSGEIDAMLFRSLNIGNVCAFVGSGVSRNYGYPTWAQIVCFAVEYVLKEHRLNPSSFIAGEESLNLLLQFKIRELAYDSNYISRDDKSKLITTRDIKRLISKNIYKRGTWSSNNKKPSAATVAEYLKWHFKRYRFDRKISEFICDCLTGQNIEIDDNDLNLIVLENCKRIVERNKERVINLSLSDSQAKSNPPTFVGIETVIAARIRKHARALNKEAVDSDRKQKRLVDPILDIHQELNIERFITINYDRQLERSLHGEDEVEKDSGCESANLSSASFYYNPDNIGNLIAFSFGKNSSEKIFHLHGDISNPDSMVLAERDYQRNYLTTNSRSSVYRKIFEAMLSSSPIVFFGVGMTEDDVLRSLRRYMSERRAGTMQRPVFALISRSDNSKSNLAATRRRLLYARYGVKVTHYSRDSKGSDGSDAFVTAIKDLAKNRKLWWEGWRRKATARRGVVHKAPTGHENNVDRYYIHGNSYTKEGSEKNLDIISNQHTGTSSIWSCINRARKSSLIFGIGMQGAGKGFVSAQLVLRALSDTSSKFVKTVYLNFSFTNDFLNSIERLTRILDPTYYRFDSIENTELIDDFLTAFRRTKNTLVIVNGLDRVLFRREKYSDLSEFGYRVVLPQPVPHGDPIDSDVERFLDGMVSATLASEPGSRNSMVILSSIIPDFYGLSDTEGGIKNSTWAFESNNNGDGINKEVVADPIFVVPVPKDQSNFCKDDLSSPLLNLFDNHAFCLQCIKSLTEKYGKEDKIHKKRKWWNSFEAELTRKLTSSAQQRRPYLLVSSIVEKMFLDLTEEEIQKGEEKEFRYIYASDVLAFLSLFHAPVGSLVLCQYLLKLLKESNEYSKENAPTITDAKLKVATICEELLAIGLLIKSTGYSKKKVKKHDRYSVHPIVRAYYCSVFNQVPDSTFEPHITTVSTFAHENNEYSSYSELFHRKLTDTFDWLLQWSEDRIKEVEKQIVHGSKKKHKAYFKEQHTITSEHLRTAYNLVRANWSATSVSRQVEFRHMRPSTRNRSRYDAYQIRLLRLHNCIRKLQTLHETSESSCEALKNMYWDPDKLGHFRKSAFRSHSVLYINELSWLYNETGVAAYCQGSTNDAYSHFVAAQEVNGVIDTKQRSYRYLVCELNLSLTELDRGRIGFAKDRLLSLVRRSNVSNDFRKTLYGYLGIVFYFIGDRNESRNYLNESLKDLDVPHQATNLSGDAIRFARRHSLFLRYRANLYMLEGKQGFKQAECDLSNSLTIAHLSNHPDLVKYTYISQAKLDRLRDKTARWDLLESVNRFAQEVGISKMEVDVAIEQAENALQQGNSSMASDYALHGLTISKSSGLEYRSTNCLVILASTLLQQGRTSEAKKVLNTVKSQAITQGYEHMLEIIEAIELSTLNNLKFQNLKI